MSKKKSDELDKQKKVNRQDKEDRNFGELELLKKQLARALADYDNLEKRVEREREGFFKYASADLIRRLLPVLDMLEQAQGHLADAGLAIAIKEFKDLLKEDGVEEMVTQQGNDFDEDLFEAVEALEVPAGKNELAGKVAEMVLVGWKFIDGTVVRPVKVKVYKKE